MTTDEGELTLPDLTPAARRILDAAAELYYLHGIHAVGVDTIAAASGVTKRTLYDRFGSKDVLVATYLRARHVAWWARLDERLEDASDPRALAVFDAYAQDAPSVERGCAFVNAAGELPAGHPARAVIRAHKHAVRARLEELVRADRPGLDASVTADHLFLLLEGGVTQRGIDGDARLMRSARAAAARLLG
ncbi:MULTISPECIES: TetR/AcrR family transcriptional regulator [unclassified Aeromicrobium]|uniref:TetR/AcrR family transcriptional regulator n=1 Tax=unclassified Aeromicrobium TaxID=2633570 RepID=UPI00396B1ACB